MSRNLKIFISGMLIIVTSVSIYQYDQQKVIAGYGQMRVNEFLLSIAGRLPDTKCDDLYLYTICVFVKDSMLLSVTCPNAKAVAHEQCVGRVVTSWQARPPRQKYRDFAPEPISGKAISM